MNFLHPALLPLAGLFTVPLIIHLINRRRYLKRPWAAMDFLLRAHKENRKRVRLESLLLLLLRCSLPILLAFVLARPRLGNQNNFLLQRAGRHQIFILDRTASMGYRNPQGGRPFDRMKKIVKTVLDQASVEMGDRTSILLAASRWTNPVRGSLDPALALRELGRLSNPTDSKGRLFPVLKEAEALSRAYKEKAKIYVLSDFQNTFLEIQNNSSQKTGKGQPNNPSSFGKDGERMADLLHDLKKAGTDLILLPLRPRGIPQNSQILGIHLEPDHPIVGIPSKVHFELRHQGTQKREVTLTLLLDGKNPQTKVLNLEPGEKKKGTFDITFPREGFHRLALRLGTDAFAADDEAFLVSRVRKEIQVLLVEGNRPLDEEEDILSRAFLLKTLLLPNPAAKDPELRIYHPEVISEEKVQADPGYLNDKDLVVLIDATGPRDLLAQRLRNFVQKGGGLLIIPGPHSVSDLYNLRLFGAKGEKGPLPARLTRIHGELPQRGMGNTFFTPSLPSVPPPLLSDFQEETERRILEATPVYRFWGASKLDLPPETRVLLELSRAPDPLSNILLAIRPFGKGQAGLLTSNLSKRPDRWNRLDDLWISLPLVHSLARGLSRKDRSRYNLFAGEAIQTRFDTHPKSLYVRLPDQRRVPLPIPSKIDTGKKGWETPAFTGTWNRGIYTIEAEFSESKETRTFAINTWPEEGFLTYASPNALRDIFPGIPIEESIQLENQKTVQAGSSEITRILWTVLLAFLVTETLLAAFFGRKRS